MIHTSPQLLRQPGTLKHAIQGTFDIELDDVNYTNVGELVDRIDDKILDNYFRNHWQGEMAKYKYSGPALIGEVNALKPRKVLDIGCGYHEFKGKIDNLIGIDPYNNKADIEVKLLDYHPQERYDATLALGSINFGSRSGGDQSRWISFYPWDSNFIINCADQLNVDILDIRTDTHKNRLYFVWRTK